MARRIRRLKKRTRDLTDPNNTRYITVGLSKRKRRKSKKKTSSKRKNVYSLPEYKRWRKAVFKRDGYACKLCGKKDYIEAHHLLRKADYPDLIFDVNNGMTLCGPCTDRSSCHGKVTGKEYRYLPTLMKEMSPRQRGRFQRLLQSKELW